MMRDYLKISFGNLIHRKKRTWLTLLGIFIGIAAVVSLLSLGFGLKSSINEQFEMMGSNRIIVTSKGGLLGFGRGGKSFLTTKDVSAVKNVPGIELVTPWMYKSGRIEFKNEIKYLMVLGMPTQNAREVIKSFNGLDIISGRNFKSGERKSVILGYNIYNGLIFDKKIRVGDKIYIQGQKFRVIGIMEEVGNPQDDSQLYIPLKDARDIFNEKKKVDMIYISVKNEKEVDLVVQFGHSAWDYGKKSGIEVVRV